MRILRQLGREDWIVAGLKALARGGAAELKVEAVARELGVTKGSFYWHFRGRSAWRDALLAYWEHRACADLAKAAPPAPGPFDWPAIERALRIWARQDVAVAQSQSRVLRERALSASPAHRAA